MDLRPFKRTYAGFAGTSDDHDFGILHDEVPLGTPLGEAVQIIIKDMVKHGAIKDMTDLAHICLVRSYRLFGFKITRWRTVYDWWESGYFDNIPDCITGEPMGEAPNPHWLHLL
jgi:hypothetical protein